jgi:hypothetical protein
MIFRQYGRSRHLKVETAEELKHVVELDEAHWVATSAPVDMLNCDGTFLRLLDHDNNGRVLCREVKDAVRWLLSTLSEHTGVTEHSETLRLDAIDTGTPQGQQIRDAAKEIISKLNETDTEKVTLQQVRQVKTQVESMPVSEAGVVLPEAAEDTEIRQFIVDVLETIGGVAHPNGAKGIGSVQLTSFLEQAGVYLDRCSPRPSEGRDKQGDMPAGEDKTAIMSLGEQKLRKYLEPRFANSLRSLIADGTRTASVMAHIRLVEKLILFQACMMKFVNNFVSFPRLYDTNSRAMFEMGWLVMDARRFNLAVKVHNRPQHTRIAETSNMYMMYVQITSGDGSSEFEVVVPVTTGGKGNLCIGKRGVFYDTAGCEYSAEVTHIIENPISFSEALLSPFQRLGRLLTGKIESITAKAEKKLDMRASEAVSTVTAEPSGQKQASGISSGGLVLGAGVALAALGSAAAYITKTLAQTSWLAIVISVLAAVLLVMVPITVVAFMRLRKRDISAILEGSGWGINTPMRLTHRQARFFTQKPRYPKGAKGIHRFGWLLLVLLLMFAGGGVVLYLLRGLSPL